MLKYYTEQCGILLTVYMTGIIICYNHNHIKLVTCFFFGGGVGWVGGSCPCCSPPLCTALLDVYVNRVFSQIHVRVAYLFFYYQSRKGKERIQGSLATFNF